MKRNMKTVLAAVLSGTLVFSLAACGGSSSEANEESSSDETYYDESSEYTASEDDYSDEDYSDEDYSDEDYSDEDYSDEDYSGESSGEVSIVDQYSPVTENSNTYSYFVDEPFYDGTISDEEDALECLYSVIEELGGDENTELVYYDAIENEEGTVFYSFIQACGGINVYSGNVKLIVDKDGQAIGLSSTITGGLTPASETAWEITQEEAEAIVKEAVVEEGEELVLNATEQTILPNSAYQDTLYAWVVYSTNRDKDSCKPYYASYVTGTGEYLYSIPVSEPGNSEALSGSMAVFAFDGLDADTWTGTVTDIDGAEREITVPVQWDDGNQTYYLADSERQIICADYADYAFNDTLTPVSSETAEFINEELITYEKFIQVYDLYESIGWAGPDNAGTPCLILMNLVDENGEPENNAFYSGKQNGFQVFSFNDVYGEGTCSDIIGHEFTHCVTQTCMTANLYENDYGAINEGMSDIMGNAIEMMLEDSPGGEWSFSERHSQGTIRSMDDPHLYQQPEYVWDKYYVPNVTSPSGQTDFGGVHTNSSILNLISYKLGEAGMNAEDQFYYWLNVALAMTPTTDYPMMTRLLPWCMETTNYSTYLPALEEAIQEGKLEETEFPESAPEGAGMITIEFPYDTDASEYEEVVSIINLDSGETFTTWPAGGTSTVEAVMDEGYYMIGVDLIDLAQEVNVLSLIASTDGWQEVDVSAEDANQSLSAEQMTKTFMHLESGDTLNIETESMAAYFE